MNRERARIECIRLAHEAMYNASAEDVVKRAALYEQYVQGLEDFTPAYRVEVSSAEAMESDAFNIDTSSIYWEIPKGSDAA